VPVKTSTEASLSAIRPDAIDPVAEFNHPVEVSISHPGITLPETSRDGNTHPTDPASCPPKVENPLGIAVPDILLKASNIPITGTVASTSSTPTASQVALICGTRVGALSSAAAIQALRASE
jgi:hypothetical protein